MPVWIGTTFNKKMMESPVSIFSFHPHFKGTHEVSHQHWWWTQSPKRSWLPWRSPTKMEDLSIGPRWLVDIPRMGKQQWWKTTKKSSAAATCWWHVATLMFGWISTWRCDLFQIHGLESFEWNTYFQVVVPLPCTAIHVFGWTRNTTRQLFS